MVDNKNFFVFVVCGAKEHIDTLHFSLTRLQTHTKHGIIVLTDSARNEIAIEHDHVVDVKTDNNFDNHQASIYLKTGLHQFLPKSANYCYLDTDVVALNPQVDQIFEEFLAPVTFAPDHCRLRKFSPYAVNCGCKEKWDEKRAIFESASLRFDKNRTIQNPEIKEKQKQLIAYFEQLKSSYIKKAWTAIRYFTSFNIFQLNSDFHFDKKDRVWLDSESGEIVLYEVDVQKIEAETGFSYNKWTQKWLDAANNDIWKDECAHLGAFIQADFQIDIKENNWQHWNGGVFLFNDESHQFLDAWHHRTLEAFELPRWKTRDQGTLIATAWQFGLQQHKTLSKKWNFIADYNKTGVAFRPNGEFTDDYWSTTYSPAFVHIYHHWGDEEWSLWQWIVQQGKSE